MGATSPGRWQVWQFFCKIGKTSLLKVTGVDVAGAGKGLAPPEAAIPIRQMPATEKTVIMARFILVSAESGLPAARGLAMSILAERMTVQ
jgi:hypothetical protein